MRSGAPNLFTVIAFLLLSFTLKGQSKENVTVVSIADTPSCYCFLGISLNSYKSASTCLSNDGALSINVAGGSGNYTYTWTNQSGTVIATTKDIQNVPTGFYFISVKDNERPACAGQHYFEVASDISVAFVTTNTASCISPGGSISAAVSGGSGQYSFEWTYPDGKKSSQQNITGLGAGQYTLKVTDATQGCSVSKTTSVKSTASLSLSITGESANTSCLEPDGSIDITTSGGSGQYKYYWYDLSRGEYVGYDQDLTGARGGQYSLYAVDQVSGCVGYQTFTVSETTVKPAFTYDVSANTACSSPFNGSIELSPSGTPGPYSVSWTSDGTTSFSDQEDIQGLAPGVYGVTITDLTTGCHTTHAISAVNPIVVPDDSSPATQVVVNQATNNSDCVSPNGGIDITINSDGAYTYFWTGPDNFHAESEDLSNLKGGNYILHVITTCENNEPPAITPSPLSTVPEEKISINLLSIITDPDNNLDPSTIEVVESPSSGAKWSLSIEHVLTLDYANTRFNGIDFIKVKACDDLDACTEQSITITVNGATEIIVYNAIAPNSTGDNKYMRIMNLPDTRNKVSIFNRWGDKVFEVTNYDNESSPSRFEGISTGGKELPSGTYFYKIEFGDGRKELTGYLALKR